MRVRIRTTTRIGGLLLGLVSVASADGGNARRFAPSPLLSPYLTLDGARSHGRRGVAFGLMSSLEDRPLIFYRDGVVTSEIIAERVALDATFAYGLTRDLDLGLTLPLVAWQAGDGLPAQGDLPSFALGDPGLGARYALLDSRDYGVGLAAIAGLTAPLGDQGGFAADAGASARLKLAVDLPLSSRLDLTVNGGYQMRTESQIEQVAVGDDLLFGLGVSWRVSTRLALLAELSGATRADGPFQVAEQTPADVNLGARYRLFGDYEIVGGFGGGALPGYGSPMWRLFVGLEATPRRHDWDADLVLDGSDACLEVPGLVGNQGCPAAVANGDADGDGISDALDECPTLAEDVDGFLDTDGCPDPDNDLDMLADADDSSPLAPEDWDGFEDEDGAPDLDNDDDGVADYVDACPLEAGPGNGCPGQASISSGGPPPPSREPNAPLVLGDTVHPARPIIFEFARPELTADARRVVAGMARYLVAHPDLGAVEVGVHVDSMGSRRWKHGLSRRRAASVRAALIAEGVPAARLRAHGYGPEVPVATNTTKAGRFQNRRVELRFLTPGVRKAGGQRRRADR